jgi:hypothetical protein
MNEKQNQPPLDKTLAIAPEHNQSKWPLAARFYSVADGKSNWTAEERQVIDGDPRLQKIEAEMKAAVSKMNDAFAKVVDPLPIVTPDGPTPQSTRSTEPVRGGLLIRRRRLLLSIAIAAASVFFVALALDLAKRSGMLINHQPYVFSASIEPKVAKVRGEQSSLEKGADGVFRVKNDLCNLFVKSPKKGYGTLIWLDSSSAKVFPEEINGATMDVLIDEKGFLWSPFSVRNRVTAIVVVTPTPSTITIRDLIASDERELVANPGQIKSRIVNELRSAGQAWVAFETISLDRL